MRETNWRETESCYDGGNAKKGSQEISRVTGKFGLGVRNEAGQKLIEFCQDNALKTLHMDITTWSTPKSD